MLRVFIQRSIQMSSPNQVRNASTAVFASKVRLNAGQVRHQLEAQVYPTYQFGLKDPSLIKSTGFINGKWDSGESKETFAVLSQNHETHEKRML